MDKLSEVWRFNLPRFTEARFKPYALAIGQATLAWNELHEHLARLFGLILDGSDRNQGLAIWQSLKVDRAKREILRAAVDTMPKLDAWPKLQEDIKWLLDSAEALEDTRNNTVHGPLQLVTVLESFIGEPSAKQVKAYARVTPHSWGGNARATKLLPKDLLAEYRYCRDQALKLRDFTDSIDHCLCDPNVPWPNRPKRPSRLNSKKVQPARRP